MGTHRSRDVPVGVGSGHENKPISEFLRQRSPPLYIASPINLASRYPRKIIQTRVKPSELWSAGMLGPRYQYLSAQVCASHAAKLREFWRCSGSGRVFFYANSIIPSFAMQEIRFTPK